MSCSRTEVLEALPTVPGEFIWLSCPVSSADLVPKEVAEKWLKYLREELPTVAFKCNTQQQKSNLGQKDRNSKKMAGTADMLNASDCLGAETLLQLLKNYARNQQVNMSGQKFVHRLDTV